MKPPRWFRWGMLALLSLAACRMAWAADENWGFSVGDVGGKKGPTSTPLPTATPLLLESFADFPAVPSRLGVTWETTTDLYTMSWNDPAYLSFQGKIWLLGGTVGGDNDGRFLSNRVLTSEDGWDWHPVPVRSIFGRRRQFAAAVFKERMWVIGGDDNDQKGKPELQGEVWSSGDGVEWTRETPQAEFGPRLDPACAVFNGKLWIVGGHRGKDYYNDVWSTDDGRKWKRKKGSAPFPARTKAFLVVQGDRLFLCGGRDGKVMFSDVWSTVDGEDWRKETDGVGVLGSGSGDFQSVISFNGKIWFLTSQQGTQGGARALRFSTDGKTWDSQAVSGATLTYMAGAAVVHEGKLYVFGDYRGQGLAVTSDGKDWKRRYPDRSFSGTYHWAFPTAIEFLGRLWVFGGGGDGRNAGGVWCSGDGWTWKEVNAKPPFKSGGRLGAAVMNGRLWVVNTSFRKVWSSPDGIQWDEAASEAGFPGREGASFLAFDGKLWLIAGKTHEGDTEEVWFSPNGRVWGMAVKKAGFGPRSQQAALVHSGKMWLIGGVNQRDVWASGDGRKWVRVLGSTPFWPEYGGLPVASCAGAIWVYPGNPRQGIWSSKDGVQWDWVRSHPPIPKRNMHTMTSFHDRLFVFGGYNGNFFADCWFSPDAPVRKTYPTPTPDAGTLVTESLKWVRVADKVAFPQRRYPLVAAWGRLWVIGGQREGNEGSTNEVWSSATGNDWKLEVQAPPFTQRWGHQVVFFKDRLWVIGGRDPWDDHNDVWSSRDGREWELVTNKAEFSPRSGHVCLVYNDKIWVISGGPLIRAAVNDVWCSSDGRIWTRAIDKAAFEARSQHAGFVFGGRMWIVGGSGHKTTFRDVWSSVNGATWTEVASTAPFQERFGHSCAIHQGRVWLIGGHPGDVWTSGNGIDWRIQDPEPPFGKVFRSGLTELNGRLWLGGGGDAGEVWVLGSGKKGLP